MYIEMFAPQFIEAYVQSHVEIEAIKIFRPVYFPPVQDLPEIEASERALIAAGLKLRDETGLSFWDATLLIATTGGDFAPNVIRNASRHNPQDLDSEMLSRRDCTAKNIERLYSNLKPGQVLAISSAVETSAGRKHIPMLDFHCKEAEQNLSTIKLMLRQLRLKGVIARSGNSYHFYGISLIGVELLLSKLGEAMLFSPVVDHRWIAHQIIERACGLRISPGKTFKMPPQIVALI